MTGRLEGKVAIVTGAAMGLGAAIATLFAEEGASVLLTDVAEEAGQAAARLARPGLFLRHDVSSPEDWEAVGRAAVERFGRIDILVNNAAILIPGSIEDADVADWRRVQAVNADGVFLGCRMAVRAMKQSGGGSIVNIASVGSHSGEAYAAAYCASKGAVRSLTKSVAVHCQNQGYGIRCNSIHPGTIDTPMVRNLREGLGLPPESPVAGDPRQFAYAALYLASDEALLVNGAELLVDSARTVTPPAPRAS
ncbi:MULTISPECIES: SDR family oxidoreductase [unclassified Sphingomonas]|uniref:SDR family oxidoreductase n=1 Tax=unclassified Sphingomonas TaxID=196159 RepID=UPI00092A7D09|nr:MULTISPECIES: SDR family oxidoreductase [unclassified Sphingomonas]MBN8849300.1 SDR family oxidoreductase [Sphingomonas sp.]OJV34433.1 MAG: short-chain dehydrogenase [Sphingomonas sp. 67-36]